MMKLLIFKEYMRKIYNRYTSYVDPAIKFLAAVLAMIVFDINIGYMPLLKNPAIVVIIGLVCAFLSWGLILGVLFLFVIANVYSLAPELAAIFLIILIVMYILYFRFAPSDSYVLILMPVLFMLKIPYVLPLIIGLIATPISIVSVGCGVMICFMIQYVSANAATITNLSTDSETQKVMSLLTGVLNNKEMYLTIISFAAVLVVVYVIRKKSIDYAWPIAVVCGGVTNIFIMFLGTFVLGITTVIPVWVIVVMSILSVGIVYVIQLLILSVDYTRTEYVQFEDDDYYYYVKAIPKINVAAQDVKVKRINARKTDRIR